MFIMLNDGGVLEETGGPGVFESLLLQRLSLFDLITQGFPIALLRGLEFRDSKVCLRLRYSACSDIDNVRRF